MNPVPPILEISGLRVQRGPTCILADIRWRIDPGQHWVILGPNGSGKTSLLSALTGYLTPTDGEIAVLGRTYGQTDWRELRKSIGLVSSSIRQMMAEDEPALATLLSGKQAIIDFRAGLRPGIAPGPAGCSARSNARTWPTAPGRCSPKANASAC